MRALAVLGGAAAVAITLAGACSSGDTQIRASDAAPPPDGPPPSDARSDTWPPDPDPPAGLPAGWQLDRSYWNQCGLYVPTAKEQLPPPPSWEPCPSDTQPSGIGCKLMVVGWSNVDPTSKCARPGYAGSARTDPTSPLVLAVTRVVSDTSVVAQIVEPDGPVHSAILQTRTNFCSLAFPSVVRDHFAWRLYEGGVPTGGGLIAGDIDALRPRVSIHLDVSHDHDVFAAPFAILDLFGETFHQWSWDDASALPPLWSSAQDDGLQFGAPVFASDATFWPASTSAYQKVKVYTAAEGVRDFLTAGAVVDHGFGDLGTDGTDLVWIEATGRSSSGMPFSTLTIMTSPFTSDPANLTPRRLRTEQGPEFDGPYFVVGCGYAARSNGIHIRVVRLSDGVSWTLPSTNGAPVNWQDPLALTCTELFASVRSGGDARAARVRLDSLGPGIPPD